MGHRTRRSNAEIALRQSAVAAGGRVVCSCRKTPAARRPVHSLAASENRVCKLGPPVLPHPAHLPPSLPLDAAAIDYTKEYKEYDHLVNIPFLASPARSYENDIFYDRA